MPYNILIVDDSGSMRKVIKKILRLSGFKMGDCLEAGNGQEALDMLNNHWVDLILSDIHMPVMDGFGLLRALREHDGWSDLPVVLITTEANEDRIREAMSLGAKGYVRKPFRPEEIRAYLLKIMGDTDGDDVAAGDEECDF
jgi:two-component system, chemotaxis family, chemotaxis protein CheY